ncbi:hypothetical protein TVAG_112470 [Trichomonas vaginalis G3]|uniref:Uncharacterized protein n=1 Tax=Trichomonas vaginalis (strain ATCC PRA-98 / G3) TaxID=412133 RepID=A2G1R5_TRIV3|nr:hypothetical protein TVAGG3_0314050 [Trichomonas vaginalis G3]EAX88893.1 hypothetical protein TVAG_112470 [Trichomonas vaginalis G3]KAI5528822.1 hypothetical protein TVAGG3_0314050 [Trichomonas vaginalis G3]|eukprot:XP_001301823.1 hypothetical protein [Trichomonas vaginalis G3]
MSYHSKLELQRFLNQTSINYSRGDSDSLKRCLSHFINLRRDFETFRRENLHKTPDVNIYHFVQFLALHGLTTRLPREADRFKFVLNLAIQQQWCDNLVNIFQYVKFTPMANVQRCLLHPTFSLFEGFCLVHQMALENCLYQNIVNIIPQFEPFILSYITFYHYQDTTIVITYTKERKKNRMIHKYICINDDIWIYGNTKIPLIKAKFCSDFLQKETAQTEITDPSYLAIDSKIDKVISEIQETAPSDSEFEIFSNGTIVW